MKLSIVIATMNRIFMLQKCLKSIAAHTETQYEMIIVDGGSEDGTEHWALHEGHTVIQQGHRMGAVKAFNAGFYAATGEYVTGLNDDLLLVDDCLDAAVAKLDAHEQYGQIAIPFNTPLIPKKMDQVRLTGEYWIYANFGVTRKGLGDKLNWWGDTHYHYAGDTELSMKIWNAGHLVFPLMSRCIYHLEAYDDTRVDNYDSPKFYKKWELWKGPGDDNPIFLR